MPKFMLLQVAFGINCSVLLVGCVLTFTATHIAFISSSTYCNPDVIFNLIKQCNCYSLFFTALETDHIKYL